MVIEWMLIFLQIKILENGLFVWFVIYGWNKVQHNTEEERRDRVTNSRYLDSPRYCSSHYYCYSRIGGYSFSSIGVCPSDVVSIERGNVYLVGNNFFLSLLRRGLLLTGYSWNTSNNL